jgi:hypothetical protein
MNGNQIAMLESSRHAERMHGKKPIIMMLGNAMTAAH